MMNISALVSALPDAPNAMVLAFIGLAHRPVVPLDPHNACSQHRPPYDAQWCVVNTPCVSRWQQGGSSIAGEVAQESWAQYERRMGCDPNIARFDKAYDTLKVAWKHASQSHRTTILKNFRNKKLGEIRDIYKKLLDTYEFKGRAKSFKLNSMANFMECLENNLQNYWYDRQHMLLMLLASQKPSPKKTPKAKTAKETADSLFRQNIMACETESEFNSLVRQNSVCAVRVLAVAEDDEDAPIGLLMKKK